MDAGIWQAHWLPVSMHPTQEAGEGQPDPLPAWWQHPTLLSRLGCLWCYRFLLEFQRENVERALPMLDISRNLSNIGSLQAQRKEIKTHWLVSSFHTLSPLLSFLSRSFKTEKFYLTFCISYTLYHRRANFMVLLLKAIVFLHFCRTLWPGLPPGLVTDARVRGRKRLVKEYSTSLPQNLGHKHIGLFKAQLPVSPG